MKVKRKVSASGQEDWVRHCELSKKHPWEVHEAVMSQYGRSTIIEIEGVEGIWYHDDFDVISDERTSFKAGDIVFCREGYRYVYDRFLGPRGHVVRRCLPGNKLGHTTTLTEVFASVPENKPVYKIFKYTLPIAERTHIDLPLGAQILRVDGLDGGLWVWAMVDTTASLERREFALFKTGGSMPDNVAEEYKYVGCGSIYIQQELCLYVFEKLRS